jgi:hypothetical protein
MSLTKTTRILLTFPTVARHESGTRKATSLSVTVYSKSISSQYNLTAYIEPVLDKYVYDEL